MEITSDQPSQIDHSVLIDETQEQQEAAIPERETVPESTESNSVGPAQDSVLSTEPVKVHEERDDSFGTAVPKKKNKKSKKPKKHKKENKE